MSWTIYGNKYDLTEFIDKHPGGKDILVKTKDMGDVTPLFETYHALSNKTAIKESLEKYKIEGTGGDTYDFTSYNALCDIIKESYKFKRGNIKAPLHKHAYMYMLCIMYLVVTYFCLLDLNILLEILLGFLLGLIWLSLGFNLMHDASHYAYVKSPRINNYASILWNSFALSNHGMWFYHHVLYHHAFTNTKKDSDMYSMVPIYRKQDYQTTWRFPLWFYPIMVYLFPGYFYGQIILYFLGNCAGYVFHKDLTINVWSYSCKDLVIIIFVINLFYQRGFFCSVAFMISCNIFYNINTIGDHETFDVLVENHYEGKDWLRLQVQNSGNFKTDSPIYTYVFGGINYQIEHHVLPNMSNCFYSQISPTVQKFCQDNNIPYVVHKSSLEVF